MSTEIEKYNVALQKAIQKINSLNTQLNQEKQKSEVAIIGYNCRFPAGADNAEKFWELLLKGYDAVSEAREDRFAIDNYYNPNRGVRGKTYTKQASFLEGDIKEFDNLHFEISGREAVSIDPQHRLMLEVSWEALENSGLDIASLRGSKTGVFIGMDSLEYAKAEFLSNDTEDITPYSLFGFSQHSAAGRVSYFYDFKGPSLMCNTACSSSLTAMDIAVTSLKNGECDLAVVGGVNLILTSSSFVALSQVQALSSDGRSKAFDASADGYGRGEGCGVIILKRTEDARRDHNEIQAIVKSIYVGQDGKANGFFAPNGLSEQQVMQEALIRSGLTVDDIDYMETHGTGTTTGDFIETSSICEVYKQRKDKILIGSVKSNIGHLEAASGIAGVIKVLLGMKYHKLPPSIHFKNPNPSINWDRLQVVDRVMDWNKKGKKRTATVSSFGISGTLAHTILEEPEIEEEKQQKDSLPYSIMTFSAKNRVSLRAYLGQMKKWLADTKNDVKDICYTSNRTKSYLKTRCAFIGTDKMDFINQIEETLSSEENFEDSIADNKKSKIKVSLYIHDSGVVNTGMVKELYTFSPVFHEYFEKCIQTVKEQAGIDLLNIIWNESLADKKIREIASFSVEYALSALWKTLHIKLDGVVGSGIGKLLADIFQEKMTLVEGVDKVLGDNIPQEKMAPFGDRLVIEIYPELPGYKEFTEQIRKIYLEGVSIDWYEFYKCYNEKFVLLPNYCFQKKSFWKEFELKEQDDTINLITKEGVAQMAEQVGNIKEKLKRIINEITGIDLEQIDDDSDFFAYGFDSLMIMSLGEQINRVFKFNISVDEFFTKFNTLDLLADYIAGHQQEAETVSKSEVAVTKEDFLKKEYIQPTASQKSQVNYVTAKNSERSAVQVMVEFQQFERVFENQYKIMSEQNELIKNLTASLTLQGGSNSAVPQSTGGVQQEILESSEHTEDSFTYKDIEEELEKKDFFVPYHKIDVDKGNGLTNLQYEYVKHIEKEFNRLTKGSKESTQHFRAVHANARNTAGFTKLLKEMTYQIVEEEGKGSKIKDVDGNEFIDIAMGFGVNLFGHAPEFILEALREEIAKGFPLGPMGRLAGTVAKQICELTNNQRVFFCNSGTEADMFALRIARAITGRNKIVIFAGAYHGTYDGVLGISMESKNGETKTAPMVPGITNSAVKDLVVLNYNTEASLTYIEEHASEIAGILIETVQSRRPDVQPKEYLKKLRKITTDKGITLIFDEVITGFRICAGGAQEFYGIDADIVTYGKIIGGGMPIGVVAGKAKFMDSVDGGVWYYGDDSVPPCNEKRTMVAGTFCHHGLAMAAAHVVLKYIKENKDTLYPELNAKTKQFVDRTNTFFREENVPFTVVQFGSLFRFYNVLLEYDVFYYSLIAKGIYIWEGRNCFFSTAHSQEDINKVFEAIKQTIYEMREYGFFKKKILIDSAPMSLIQQRLYSQIEVSKEDPYDMVSSYYINKEIDLKRLEQTLQEIVDRHEILRTELIMEGDQFRQRIVKHISFHIKHITKKNVTDVDEFVQNVIQKFDLAKAPLFEVLYVEIENSRPLLVFHFHHTVADGVSMAVLVKEVSCLYNGIKLHPVDKQYREYAEWENRYLMSEACKEDKEYWLETLNRDACSINLNSDFIPERNSVYACATVEGLFDASMTEDLKGLGKKNAASLFMVLFSGISLFLHKMAYQDDIAIITPVTNRYEAGFENGIGMFTNTGVLRSTMDAGETYVTYLKRIRTSCLKAYRHFNYPFHYLVNDLKINNSRVFNVGYVYENIDTRATESSGLEMEHIEYVPSAQEYDLKFEILEDNGALHIYLRYRRDIFARETIQMMEKRFRILIKQIISNPEVSISELNLATNEEKEQILHEFNRTTEAYPKDKTIVDLFEEQVKKMPEQVALLYKTGQMTFQEMNEKVNRLAHSLRNAGISRDDRVVICGDRTKEFVIGMYAVMKAGGAYVPVDPTHPAERIRFIIEDCKAKVVLVEDGDIKIQTEVPKWNLKDETIFSERSCDPEKINQPEDLIYCIYTSGTTGKPKGVMVEHRSVVNYTYYSKLHFSEINRTIPLLTNCCFDLAGTPLFLAPCYGSTLEIADVNEEIDIAEYLSDEKYDCIKMTPSHLKIALESKKYRKLEMVKHIVVGGEVLDNTTVSAIKKRYGENLILHNEYGPTEATIGATAFLCNGLDEKILIGKPLSNIQIYIMNGKALCGIGVTGEICIAGDCLARGYMNLPELTDRKFVGNPFGEGKMYRTGDLAYWTPDGNIKYVVRMDDQVKIRGYRIEISEIEHALHEISYISDAVVAVRENTFQEKVLCAYITAQKKVNFGDIRKDLSNKVPEYMMPQYIMQIDHIPVTKNGKVDKRQLPEIEFTVCYEAPVSEEEKELCKICEKVLGVERIGIKDNFFEIGGDSIKAIRIVAKMEEKGYEVSIKDIMQKPSLQAIAASISKAGQSSYKKELAIGTVCPTPILKEFEKLQLVKPSHYNQAVMYRFTKEEADCLQQALNELVSHHDILRAVYREHKLEVLDDKSASFPVIEHIQVDENVQEPDKWIEMEAGIQQGNIDMEKGPMLRAVVFEMKEECHFLLCIHHLLVDGVSWRILSEDLQTAIRQLVNHEPVSLPEKTASFVEWSFALQKYSESGFFKKEKQYWNEVESLLQDGNLKLDENSRETGIGEVICNFDKDITEKLIYQSNHAFHTEINDLFVTIIGNAVHRLTGQPKITIGLEGHGREELPKKIRIYRTVGWFTCKYPVIVTWNRDLEQMIIETKEMMHRVPNHGFGYSLQRENYNPDEISLYFNYMGEMDLETGTDILSEYSVGRCSADENGQAGTININCLVMDHTLKLSVCYDRSRVSKENAWELVQNIKESVTAVVDFCSDRKEDKKTASDYGAKDMQLEEFSEMINMLNE